LFSSRQQNVDGAQGNGQRTEPTHRNITMNDNANQDDLPKATIVRVNASGFPVCPRLELARKQSVPWPHPQSRTYVDQMRLSVICILIAAASGVSGVRAQTALISAPSGTKTLAATLKVYAFPAAGQAPAQQSKDESECYNWGVQETGTDPFHVANHAAEQQQQAAQQQQQAQQSTSGSGVKGAVGGAAGGAMIGAVAGNAGKGAAIGAGVGAIGNRARAQSQANQASQQATRESQEATKTAAAQMTEFKKAFSACLEAKKYTVKY
jgi:hypothetical protein